MNKKIVVSLVTILVVGFSIFTLMYTAPKPISQHMDNIDMSKAISVLVNVDVAYGESVEFEIGNDDEKFAELLKLFENREFSKSISSLLPVSSNSHTLEKGDVMWKIAFNFEDYPLNENTTLSEPTIVFENFYGDLSFRYNSKPYNCETTQQAKWIEDVKLLIA